MNNSERFLQLYIYTPHSQVSQIFLEYLNIVESKIQRIYKIFALIKPTNNILSFQLKIHQELRIHLVTRLRELQMYLVELEPELHFH